MATSTATKVVEKVIDPVDIKEIVTVKVIETIKGRPRVMEGARIAISPVFDESKGTTALKTGIERSEWKLHYEPLFGDYDKFYADFVIVLTAQTRRFDMSEPRNKLVVALLRNHPFIAKSMSEITQSTLFVLFDEIAEAAEENKSFEFELTAFSYLKGMSQTEKGQFLKLFGVRNTETVSPEIIMKRLKDKAKEDPKSFVELWEDKNREIKILIEDLLQYGIIKRTGGVFIFGDPRDGITMGSTVAQTVEFIKSPKHSELMAQIIKMLEAKKSVSV